MLVTTELAEAAEAWREHRNWDILEELADVLIRVFNLAGALGMDLERAVQEKYLKNLARPFLHGGKRA